MWKVSYREQLEFEGVKENIKAIKARKKEQMKSVNAPMGYSIEEGISKILSDIPGFNVKMLPPQYDIGFGADLQVSYMEDGKNYSAFVDITSSYRKPNTTYLAASGELVNSFDEAFCYRTEYFNIRFGLKEKHMNHFFYEKPVMVLHIENYTPTTGLGLHHIHVIGSLIANLNSLLMRQGYGARASQLVRPNIKKFPKEYQAFKKGVKR